MDPPSHVLLDWVNKWGLGLMIEGYKMTKGDDARDSWVMKQVSKGMLQQVPRVLVAKLWT